MATVTATQGATGSSTGAPWWGWVLAVGLVLWGAGSGFSTPITLALVAALVYQFMHLK